MWSFHWSGGRLAGRHWKNQRSSLAGVAQATQHSEGSGGLCSSA
jgi:hypothetical protein